MSKRMSILKFEVISTIFIMVLGGLLHFTFESSNNNPFVGIFSPINESVWEHLKLIFFPMLISTIIGAIYWRDSIPNYLCSKTKGIIVGLIFIVVFFYTYTGILGYNLAVFDIGIFFIAVILGQCFAYKKIISMVWCNNLISIVILGILVLSFVVFTFFPPNINLFQVPTMCIL